MREEGFIPALSWRMQAVMVGEGTSEATHCDGKSVRWFAFIWVDQEVEKQQEVKAGYRNLKASP